MIKTVETHKKIVFLQLGISRMGDKRGVSSEDFEVDADKELVTARKKIFKSPAFDRIKSLDGEIRRWVRSQCFPYETGLHIAALDMMPYLNERLNRYFLERSAYIDTFAAVFPTLAQDFSPKLRKLWRDKDYDIDDVASHFSMYWYFIELKTPDSLDRVSAEAFRTEKNKLEQRFAEAFEEARMILRETCLRLVTHLREQLGTDAYGAQKRLSSPTVMRLQEFVDTFSLRNITNDNELQIYVNQLKSLTRGIDAESLRTMDGLRARVRSELDAIESSLTEAVELAPTRRIRGITNVSE